jgi:DNA polymerase III subunit gamma/tau
MKEKQSKEQGQLTAKYRPKSWKTFVGNNAVVEAIQKNLEKENMQRTIMLVGPYGVGKTTVARIIKRELKINDQDYRELDVGSVRGIDSVREMIKESQYKPLMSKHKLYVLDEAHRGTPDAKEAMLKWLEEPPKHTVIILATTSPSQFPNTIISRCAYYEFKSLPKAKIKKILSRIINKEQLSFDDTIVDAIVDNANGSPRQAVSILDAIIGLEDEKNILKVIERNQFSEASVLDICQGLVNDTTWKIMAQYLSKLDDDADYEYIRYAVLKYMGKVLLNPKSKSDPNRICEIITLFSEPFFYSKKAGLISSCYLALKI